MRGLNLDYLRTFLDVLESGSFSATAKRMDLTQPAVSVQVRQLEKRLGVRLVERTGRAVRPTAAGVELAENAARIDALVSAAVEGMARHATGVVGRVRIGTGATACIFLLPPVLRDLRRRFPTIEITVSTGNTADIARAIDDNTIDVGLVTLPVAGRMFDIAPLLVDEFVAIAPPGMRLSARMTAEALAKLPVLLFEPGGNTRRIGDEWFARAGVTLRPVMSLGSVEAIKELVRAGLGCAVLPGMAVRKEKDRKGLVVRPLYPKLQRTLALVVRHDKPLSPPLRETLKALRRLA